MKLLRPLWPCLGAILWIANFFCGAPSIRAEAMLEYFNTSWNEITAKMPELAEAGYDSIWIPPPTKAGGALSVGYDVFDPFDLGSKDQNGTVSTFYGTQADLLRLVQTAHRFGIRVYLDNVMNHRGFGVPGTNAATPIDLYPGMLPEDFHMQTTPDGFYLNWPGISDYSNQWQVWNLSTSNLMDIAQEPGTTNLNFGTTEGSTHPKISFVRHPNNPEYYCYKPDGTYVGFGTNNGITAAMIAANPTFYSEYVQDYLARAARWELDLTKADGFRLDAVKHVRDDFFGAEYGSDKNSSTYGYLGQISQQFKLSRGFSGTDYRSDVFNTELPRTDAMYFGEHLGGTPQQPYIDAGMRLLDNALSGTLNGVLPTGSLAGLDVDGGGGIPGGSGVEAGYAQSADNGYAVKRQLQHAFLLTRAGLPIIYTDGYHLAGILSGSSAAFPANAYTNFLGQFGDDRIPNLLYIHNQFSRGNQISKWSDQSVLAYERQDKRENSSMSDADGTTMLFMMNCDSANGEGGRAITTTFPAGSYLYQYAAGVADNGDTMQNFYYTVPSNQQVSDLVIPKGGYFALSWRTPEMPSVNASAPAISILQNGQAPSTLTYARKDGPDGDPAFNPYGLPDADTTDYQYSYTVPCVTNGANLSFLARADGSAENILMELDGGLDINSQMNLGPLKGDLRDNPPGVATDVFLGYEQMQFVQRTCEKFAAEDTSRNIIGSVGAETYQAQIGTAGFTVNDGSGYNSSISTATYAYHNPVNTALDGQAGATLQFYPAPENATGSPVTVWLKTGYEGQVNAAYLYYTTDGATYPEGSGGVAGNTATRVVQLTYQQHGNNDGSNVTDWWSGTLPALAAGTVLRYKIGAYNTNSSSVFPSSADAVTLKKLMETRFQVTGFNATTAVYHPDNDYGPTVTGLGEGFHVLRTRQFLNRQGRASIYNTSVQTFYYDAQPPSGAVVYPATDNTTITDSSYGVVVRTDPTVTEVWYKILDGDPTNDDSATTANNGNGEWVQATELTANPTITSSYPNEWRFNYVNVPSSGTAKILVRLRELTSAPMVATDTSTDASTDAANHWTTLIRNVNTAGPAVRMFVAYPATDGTVVSSSYVMKVWFSKSLANNLSTADLISRFLIKIASTASGSPTNGVVQGQANYSINYNVTSDYDELAYQLPNLYNGNPDFLHTIDVTYTQPGAPTLESYRLVKAYPVTVIQDNIVNPPEYDADGVPYIITLPDVATPTAAQRSYNIEVQTDPTATNVVLAFTNGSGTTSLNAGSPTVSGTGKSWDFTWSNIAAGSYTFTSTVTTPSGTAVTARDATIVFRQVVTATTGKLDNDDDGIPDDIETTQVPLPTTSADTWTNDDVHRYIISGKTNPLSPDTDGDGLSDGLELGLTTPMADPGTTADTNTTTDTNGDGLPNFQVDFDPPVFNTTDNASAPSGQDYSYYGSWPYNYNNGRTDQIAGTMTDPTKADTDSDGLSDGLEDLTFLPKTDGSGNPVLDGNGHQTYQAFHNGRVDVIPDGTSSAAETVIAHPPTIYNSSVIDRVKLLSVSPNAQYLETDPNNNDTDGDGLADGAEDVNHNGIVDLAIIDRNKVDANGNFVVLATFTSPTQFVQVQGSTTSYTAPAVVASATVKPAIKGAKRSRNRTTPKTPTAPKPTPTPATTNPATAAGSTTATAGSMTSTAAPTSSPSAATTTKTAPAAATTTAAAATKNSGKTVAATPPAATFYYLDFCYQYIEPMNGKVYVSTALDKKRLNAVFRPNGGFRSDGLDVIWLETDPRRASTSGDGLPDGWKEQYGLNPFDDGVIGDYNLHTGLAITNTNNGPLGDPDGDGVDNYHEYLNGSNPTVSNTAAPPPAGSITIGPEPASAQVTYGAVTNDKAFTDWTAADLIALGYYDGAGPNYNGSDVYHAYDGYDTSRNLIAFYAHDGGAASAGGDGNFYFRVDLEDLQAYAEQGYLDIYVAINVGKPGVGERLLPDQIDTLTNMGWQAVVACYQTNQGTVYVDTDPVNNTTGFGQDLSSTGVVSRPQGSANGFKLAYFSSDLDAVEFSISRQALLDAGWDGLDASDLIYQVYTTKDGTQDDPPGPGNIGGRSDIRCCLYNDYIASDYYGDQAALAGTGSVLKYWCGLKAGNDNGKRVKVVSIAHGNQPILPGSSTQALINNNAGAGYYRPLDAHQAYDVPLTMHITPTLASAIQWAAVDPAAGEPYRDGPALNTRIGTMAGSGLVDLLGSTFSDHILPYFDATLTGDNVALANEFLTSIYKTPPSTQVFWTPEQVSNDSVLATVADIGFASTFLDQTRHIEKWFGRTSELSTDGYRLNRINGTDCFVINDGLSSYLFQNQDNGVPTLLRQTLLTTARSTQQDQIIVMMNDWESFDTQANADAYDKNIRWLASHPWVEIVTPDEIVNAQVDTSVPPDGVGDAFGYVDRGTGLTLPLVAQDWLDHATEENYDNWYDGSSLEESLSAKLFNIRPGAPMPEAFGLEAGPNATGLAHDAWNSVQSMAGNSGNLLKLARGVYHASLFETAFHNNTNNDLDKFSTGAYIYPDTNYMTLADFAAQPQAQIREAAILARVGAWSTAAAGGAYLTAAVAQPADIDLDGEPEYLLYNDRLFAVLEAIGGRMTGAWIRDLDTNQVFQVTGNYLSTPGVADETEGNTNVAAGAVASYRTSGFKDWYAQTSAAAGTNQYVNAVYTVTAAGSGTGWTFTSSDGCIQKTITLAALKTQLEATYTLSGGLSQLYVRFGLSPNLYDLLLRGQMGLSGTVLDADGEGLNLFDTTASATVRAYLRYGGGSYNAVYSSAATDRDPSVTFTTVNLRNEAQTQQVEITGGTTMRFALGFQTGSTITYSSANDGLPDWWKLKYGLNPGGPESINGPNADPDGDGLSNLAEYLFGTNPLFPDSASAQLSQSRGANGVMNLTFPTIKDRIYTVLYSTNLAGSFQTLSTGIIGTGATMTVTDNGSVTGSLPSTASQRFYRLSVSLP